MPMRVNVNVNESDIGRGEPNCGGSCPIALAVLASIPGLVDIDVSALRIAIRFDDVPRRFGDWWTDENPCFRARTPPIAADFMDRFDDGGLCRPISFVLDFGTADPTA